MNCGVECMDIINDLRSLIATQAVADIPLVPVARRVDNFNRRINPYPADKIDAYLILIGQRANVIH